MKKYLSIFLIFFLLFGFSFPAFAEIQYEPPALDPTKYDSYLIVQTDDRVGCLLYLSSDWNLYKQDGILNTFNLFSTSESAQVPYYSSVYKSNYASNGWGTFNQSRVNSWSLGSYDYVVNFTVGQPTSVVSSNKNIYIYEYDSAENTVTFTDEVFFSPTPPLVVETEKALTQFQTQTSQTMMIILLCGVGCLALLISLPLLKKALYRFLNR